VKTSGNAPFFDIHPVTGTCIEVFYADNRLVTFGRGGSGWFWQIRERGYAAERPAAGPFPTSYAAYRDAFGKFTYRAQFGRRITTAQWHRLSSTSPPTPCARPCKMAEEQNASDVARAAARAAGKPISELVKFQLLMSADGGESGIRTHGRVRC
jgi:hypothetical protein